MCRSKARNRLLEGPKIGLPARKEPHVRKTEFKPTPPEIFKKPLWNGHFYADRSHYSGQQCYQAVNDDLRTAHATGGRPGVETALGIIKAKLLATGTYP